MDKERTTADLTKEEFEIILEALEHYASTGKPGFAKARDIWGGLIEVDGLTAWWVGPLVGAW